MRTGVRSECTSSVGALEELRPFGRCRRKQGVAQTGTSGGVLMRKMSCFQVSIKACLADWYDQ